MEIRLPMLRDSHNTYPNDKLLVSVSAGSVDGRFKLQFEGSDRLVEVDGRELQRALVALIGEDCGRNED